ncbi:serine carboxypeptidase-like protein 51 [Tanacetum coccineum]
MNSYTFMGIDLDGEEEEVTSRKKTVIKRAIAFIKNRRRANRVTRNHINRDRYGAHERLVTAFFSEEPMYDEVKFQKTFRMARPLFNEIVTAVIDHDLFFRNNTDHTGKEGISGLLKCTSSIRQLAYGVHAEFLDEYMQISERSSRLALDHFCQSVMQIYGPEYLRKPTVTDVEKLYLHQEEKHGFSGMLGSLDCTDLEWRSPQLHESASGLPRLKLPLHSCSLATNSIPTQDVDFVLVLALVVQFSLGLIPLCVLVQWLSSQVDLVEVCVPACEACVPTSAASILVSAAILVLLVPVVFFGTDSFL